MVLLFWKGVNLKSTNNFFLNHITDLLISKWSEVTPVSETDFKFIDKLKSNNYAASLPIRHLVIMLMELIVCIIIIIQTDSFKSLSCVSVFHFRDLLLFSCWISLWMWWHVQCTCVCVHVCVSFILEAFILLIIIWLSYRLSDALHLQTVHMYIQQSTLNKLWCLIHLYIFTVIVYIKALKAKISFPTMSSSEHILLHTAAAHFIVCTAGGSDHPNDNGYIIFIMIIITLYLYRANGG